MNKRENQTINVYSFVSDQVTTFQADPQCKTSDEFSTVQKSKATLNYCEFPLIANLCSRLWFYRWNIGPVEVLSIPYIFRGGLVSSLLIQNPYYKISRNLQDLEKKGLRPVIPNLST